MNNLILESVQQLSPLTIFIIGILIGSAILDIVLGSLLIAKRKTYKRSQKLFRWFWITFTISYILFFLFAIFGFHFTETIITFCIFFVPAIILLTCAFVNKHKEKKSNTTIKQTKTVTLQDFQLLQKQEVESKTILCSYCGLKVDKTEKKCPNCGAHIK